MPRAFLGGGNVSAAALVPSDAETENATVEVTLANGGMVIIPAEEYASVKAALDLPVAQPAPEPQGD